VRNRNVTTGATGNRIWIDTCDFTGGKNEGGPDKGKGGGGTLKFEGLKGELACGERV